MKRLMVLACISLAPSFGLTGCQKTTEAPAEQPKSEQPATAQPTGEHPHAEHPTGEHPSAEHPK